MRSFILNLNIVCLLAVCLFSCGSRHSSNLLLHQVDSLLGVRADSALVVLQNIASPEKMSAEDRAYYALLVARAMDKNDLPLLSCDSLLDFALDYYEDDDKEMAVALLYKGRLLAEMDDEKAAIENSLKALEVLQDYPKDTDYRGLIYSALGLWYGTIGLYDKALEILDQSLFYSFSPKDSSINYNNISFIYDMREEADSAISYQQKALDYAYLSGDSSLIISSLHNMSLRYDSFEHTDSAISYARKVMTMISSENIKDKSKYYYNMGDLYLSLAEYDSAKYYLNYTLSFSDAPISIYHSLSDLETQLGNYEKANSFLEEYAWKLDSVLNAESVTEIQHLVYRHQTEIGVKNEQMASRRILWRIVFVSAFLVFVIILIYQNRINVKKKERVLLQQSLEYAAEKVRVMQQQISKNESIIAFLQKEQDKNVIEIDERKQLIEQLKEEIFHSRTYLFQQTPIYKKVKALSSQEKIEKKKRKPLTTLETENLKKTVFEIYSDYISSLQEKYPSLTQNDLFLLCLQHIELSPLSIALCFGYSDTLTINQRKSRMKAKMS